MSDCTSDGSDGDGGGEVAIDDEESATGTFLTIAVFVIAFVLIGVLLPQIVAIYAPPGHYVEIHDVRTYNTTTNATSYTVEIERTVHHPTDGTILMELMRVENGTSEQAAVFFGRHYFSDWEETVYYTRPLPDGLKPGTYYWVVHVQLHYSGIERSITARSESFTVTNSSETESGLDGESGETGQKGEGKGILYAD